MTLAQAHAQIAPDKSRRVVLLSPSPLPDGVRAAESIRARRDRYGTRAQFACKPGATRAEAGSRLLTRAARHCKKWPAA